MSSMSFPVRPGSSPPAPNCTVTDMSGWVGASLLTPTKPQTSRRPSVLSAGRNMPARTYPLCEARTASSHRMRSFPPMSVSTLRHNTFACPTESPVSTRIRCALGPRYSTSKQATNGLSHLKSSDPALQCRSYPSSSKPPAALPSAPMPNKPARPLLARCSNGTPRCCGGTADRQHPSGVTHRSLPRTQ